MWKGRRKKGKVVGFSQAGEFLVLVVIHEGMQGWLGARFPVGMSKWVSGCEYVWW